ncbi:MAG: HupE/UreJ family protein, partial [Methylobacter sp.]
MKKIILVAALIAFSDAALSHTGLLPTDGFSHGFQHPFLGLDHFLVMLGLGLWASSQAHLLALQTIGVFLLFMIVGALFGLAGFGFAYVETAILISLLLVGMALSFGTTPIVPTLQSGNSVRNAPALRWRDAGASDTAFPFMPQRVRRSVGTIIILASIAAFASMHGLAHGSALPINASAYAYIAGFVSATAVLHISGLALGWIAQR